MKTRRTNNCNSRLAIYIQLIADFFLLSYYYLNVIGLGSVLVEAFAWCTVWHVQQGFESDFSLGNKVHLGQRFLGVLGQRLVELVILSLSDIGWPNMK